MLHSSRAHDWLRGLVFTLGTAILIALELLHFAPWQKEELSTRDWLMRYGRLTPANPDLVFLAIDEPSLTLDDVFADDLTASPELRSMKASGWPWSRDVYATLIDKLVNAGARVVALDILFNTAKEGDETLRAALLRHGDKVVIGSAFVIGDQSTTVMMPAQTLAGTRVGVGFVNYWTDMDGIVRRTYFRRTASEAGGRPPYPGEPDQISFPGRILEKLGDAHALRPSRSGEIIRFTQGVKTDRVRDQAFETRSLYRVFVPPIWNGPEFGGGAFFKGKIVVVGPEGSWSKDYVETTFSRLAGPDLHLQVLNAALHGEFIGDVSQKFTAVWTAIAGLLAWLVAIRIKRPDVRLLVLGGLTVLAVGLAALVYNGIPGLHAHSLPVLGVVVALLGISALWIAWDQLYEMRERRRVRRTLERYVSKNLVREILDNPLSYFNTIGGVRKPVAVMFTDLRGFTAMTEHADSHQIVAHLNEYLNEMVRHVFEHEGTLDKFIGDAIMAEWGNLHSAGPRGDVEHAVAAAMAMLAGLRRLNAEWAQRGWSEFKMGIGINHGEVIVGNIGSSTGIEKMDPTVIGDAVNLASRLEGLTKEYGVDLLLGESAGQLAATAYHVRELDFVVVKGRTQPVAIYEVIGARSEPLAAAMQQRMEHYAAALAEYRAGDFAQAKTLFAACAEAGDRPARLFAQRCDRLLERPPGPEWKGAYVMTEK